AKKFVTIACRHAGLAACAIICKLPPMNAAIGNACHGVGAARDPGSAPRDTRGPPAALMQYISCSKPRTFAPGARILRFHGHVRQVRIVAQCSLIHSR
ncbi:MAG TPA: hypothetical protein VF523_03320, partial [Burkholderiales bacterium]